MIWWLAVAAAISATPIIPAQAPSLKEAAHAIEAGRLDQARIMIANAVKEGAHGAAIDRLVADLAFASEDWNNALPAYQALIETNPTDPMLAEHAAIAAIRLGQVSLADRLLQPALDSTLSGWRAWNAAGIIADHQGRWELARDRYAKAAKLSPDRPEILNNMGWSMLVQGRWDEALALIERAASLDSGSTRIAANLELARAAISEDLPKRRSGEGDGDWAARLNDAGVIARIQGNRQKAIAAFARAVEARSEWFERAANNLALVEGSK